MFTISEPALVGNRTSIIITCGIENNFFYLFIIMISQSCLFFQRRKVGTAGIVGPCTRIAPVSVAKGRRRT